MALIQFDSVAFLSLVSQGVNIARDPGISKQAGGVRIRCVSLANIASQAVRFDTSFTLNNALSEKRLLL